jgi:hypothetical protein
MATAFVVHRADLTGDPSAFATAPHFLTGDPSAFT